MLNRSDAYAAAIVGDSREMLIQAVVDITDPDLVYGSVVSSTESPYSNADQLHDRVFSDPAKKATLETNRWLLDGTFGLYSEEPNPAERNGFISGEMSGDDGTFANPQYAELTFSGVSVLQACSVYFPKNGYDGLPEDFVVEIKQGGTAYHTETYTGNTAAQISISGFTVYDPDAIRVTVTKWSLPGRRFRAVEIIPGIYEAWDGSVISSFSIKQQGDVSNIALPYGTCSISMDNLDRRFEPRSKAGIFKSIEERQGIEAYIGPRLPDGTEELKHVGTFYQYSGGWRTGDNGLSMTWNLVDIVGLLVDRAFIPPATLPTTLEGWLAALVAQLGENFTSKYIVGPEYAGLAATVKNAAAVDGKTCGEILRNVCMATGTWPRADAATGKLTAEPLWSEGNKLTLGNMERYPVMKANEDVAALIFKLSDGTQHIVSGTSAASSATKNIDNPFLHTQADAIKAAKLILAAYGGNKIEVVGRGDPAGEIGDVDTVWLDQRSATTARRVYQTLQFRDGVLRGCTSTLLQADGTFLFEGREIITEPGTWTAPDGATQIRLILVGDGENGGDGQPGTFQAKGEDGADGRGGAVWYGKVNINRNQTFTAAFDNGMTSFGAYSSANGSLYAYGFTDVESGDSFARPGVEDPLPGSGDGGKGGKGGRKGNAHTETIHWHSESISGSSDWYEDVEVIDNYPGEGDPGVAGATGCVVVYWNKG